MKLKVRRAEARRSSRVDAAEVQILESARLFKVAMELSESRGFLRKCGVTRAVVLSDRVFIEVTRFRPAPALIALAVGFYVALALAITNYWTPLIPPGSSDAATKALVQFWVGMAIFGFLVLFGTVAWLWRSRVIRFNAPLSEWAAPSGRLLVFVREAENAVGLAGGVEESNRRLCETAAQVSGASRRLGHSAFDRFRMELRGFRGA